MKNKTARALPETIGARIISVRGQKVLLDSDLAAIYGVTTKVLNQAVKRNRSRFPPDFVFQLTAQEKAEVVTNCDHLSRLKFSPVLPLAYTEHGSIMAANVLTSRRAVHMSVFVVRAFLKMRAAFADTGDLARKLSEVEAELKSRLNIHETVIVEVLQRIMQLLDPPPEPPSPEPPRRQIGFHAPQEPTGGTARRHS